jgi:hypothetical protein
MEFEGIANLLDIRMKGKNYGGDGDIAGTQHPDIFQVTSRKHTRVLGYLLRFYLINLSTLKQIHQPLGTY